MNKAVALEEATTCYHCGEAVPPDCDFSIEIAGSTRPMCCPGCRAVAGLISDSGLARFYEQRTTLNERPAEAIDTATYRVYDDPELLRQFSELEADGTRHARLLIGGVSCAACTWLIERSLLQNPAVRSASLNLAQSRLDVSFEDSALAMSELFARISALGYSVEPWHAGQRQQQARGEQRQDLRRLAVAGIGMMQVGMFAIALHAGDIQGIDDAYRDLMRWVSLAVTSVVVLFCARGFFESAYRHLRVGALVMDLPVALAIGLAWLASMYATFTGSGDVYFDSVVMFTFLLLLARFVERRVRYRDALQWRDAQELLPDAVRLWRQGAWSVEPRTSIAGGERILLPRGMTVPIDGVVYRGESSVREDTFNGEAEGRSVGVGDTVFAGTINLDDAIEIQASGTYAETRLAALQRSIDDAGVAKPAIARLADRLAARFIFGVLAVSAITALVWLQLDPGRALWVSLSVLVASCPCALSLATPAALASSASALRRRGVLLHGEDALESLPRCTHMLFDKTGTITSGALRLARLKLLAPHPDEQLVRAYAVQLQRYSNHPVAAAFSASDDDAALSGKLERVRHCTGAGMEGVENERIVRMGSAEFCRELCQDFPREAPDNEHYWVGLCFEDQPLAWFGLADDTRPETPALLQQLAADGVATELLTGDSSPRALALGRNLEFTQVFTGQSPEQKMARVAALQESGAIVAMVGDGLNDAPVLKLADTSIAVAGATDLARAQADFVLLRGDLLQIQSLRRTAARTRRIIYQNFAWALGYNVLAIPLAAMGLIPPWAAALGMSFSSLLVVGNSLRLRRS